MCAQAVSSPGLLRFDVFELNLQTQELWKRGVKLRLQGQPIQLLAILLASPGQLVTRDDLKAALWPADTFVDFDHGLHNAIARIREVLGDSASAPRFIETLPRRGYRFIGAVEQVDDARPTVSEPTASATSAPGARDDSTPAHPEPSSRSLTSRIVIAIAALLAVVALGGFVAWQRVYAPVPPPLRHALAVLPLENLSGDASQDPFAIGLTDELITEISHVPSLKVLSRTSVMAYADSRKPLKQIARELDADRIVEGSVVREGDQVRVTVQLIDGQDDHHLWSEAYQRPVRSMLSLQREVAHEIATHIGSTLAGPSPQRRNPAPLVDPESYDAYLRGRYYLYNQFSKPEALTRARQYFETSIAKDAGFAQPHAGLANVYLNMALFRQLAPEDANRRVTRALDAAARLDESLSEARGVVAILNWQYTRDWAAAGRTLEDAIAQAPSDECLRAYHAQYLAWLGKRAEALNEVTVGRALDPGSSYATTESSVYYQLGDFPQLIESSRRGTLSDPGEWLEHHYLGVGLLGTGRPAEAIPEFERAVSISGGDQDARAALAYSLARAGRRDEADAILRELTRRSSAEYVSPYILAAVHAGLDQHDAAFTLLEQAVRERSLDVVRNIKVDPRLATLRGDPRFQALMTEAGLPR
jgi:TolB-like protein/DNA-binding winged helix-turn-helix (wHTH) protein/tetratricopeptide (TPR) repeat protein